LPGERDDRHPEGDNEGGHRHLEVADVIEEMGAKGPNLLGGPADVLRGEPQFHEPSEVADEEHETVADEADASQRDELCAEIGRGGDRPPIRCRGRMSRHGEAPLAGAGSTRLGK
jgi:hypothetical protein